MSTGAETEKSQSRFHVVWEAFPDLPRMGQVPLLCSLLVLSLDFHSPSPVALRLPVHLPGSSWTMLPSGSQVLCLVSLSAPSTVPGNGEHAVHICWVKNECTKAMLKVRASHTTSLPPTPPAPESMLFACGTGLSSEIQPWQRKPAWVMKAPSENKQKNYPCPSCPSRKSILAEFPCICGPQQIANLPEEMSVWIVILFSSGISCQ